MGDLEPPIDATDNKTFLAPVKLEGLTKGKLKRDKCLGLGSIVFVPATDKVGDSTVAARISLIFDLFKEGVSAGVKARKFAV